MHSQYQSKYSAFSLYTYGLHGFSLRKITTWKNNIYKLFQRQTVYYYYYPQSAKPPWSSDNTSEILGHLSECGGRTQCCRC